MLFQIFVDMQLEVEFMHFENIMPSIINGSVDAGVILHEGQVLYEKDNLIKIIDLGEEWFKKTSLPIPLGVDLVNRKFDESTRKDLTDVFYRSVKYAIENEDEALKYAMTYGRDLSLEEARKFVRMYVNQDTLDMGDEGHRAIIKLFALAKERGIISSIPDIDLIFPH